MTKSTITPELRKRILFSALYARRIEERLLRLYSEGKLSGTVHTCIGQELSGAIVSQCLEEGDAVFSTHRCHGHFHSRTGDTRGLFAEVMGKAVGVCGGLGGSQHLHAQNFYSGGIQGALIPVAAGVAFARKMNGRKDVVVAFLGDGTLGQGVVYETLNIAARWELPVLFVLEDNLYAQSTHQRETLAGTMAGRAEAFGIPYLEGDTWRWESLYETAHDAIRRVRLNQSPVVLKVATYRLGAHSKGDDLRPPEEVASYSAKDPLNALLSDETSCFREIQREIDEEIERVVRQCETEPSPRPRSCDHPSHLRWTRLDSEVERPETVVSAINSALKGLMEESDRVLVIGQDVRSPYGGAFKVSQGLSDLFPDRVMNTPISEAATTGLGIGLALEGYRPFVEIMFGDFTLLAADQIINIAAKIPELYGGKKKAELIIRTPMGGHRGYGPTHSQTLDRHFLGVPGLRVIALNNLVDPRLVFRSLTKGDAGPTLLIENKALYAMPLRACAPQGFERLVSDDPFPVIHFKPISEEVHLTLLGYGGMAEVLVEAIERLFDEYDVVAQLICPTQIHPFVVDPLIPILRSASRLVVVEEGQGFAGFGSELISQVAERDLRLFRCVRRVCAAERIIPASAQLEKDVLPSLDRIIADVLNCYHESR